MATQPPFTPTPAARSRVCSLAARSRVCRLAARSRVCSLAARSRVCSLAAGLAITCIIALGVAPNPALANFSGCEGMFPGATPPPQQADAVVDLCESAGDQPLFAVRFDVQRKIPVWTAHRLSPEQMAAIRANSGKMKRPRFSPDPKLAADDQARDRSYVRSGYSRGHMVPAHDMSWSIASYNATFHFSNVAPQKQAFNAGTWLGAENAFRAWVEDLNAPLWVFSGTYGTATETQPTIGMAPNTPTVPKCYYKVIVAPQSEGQPYQVMTLLFTGNDFAKRAAWTNAVTSLDTVRVRSGIDFLAGLAVRTDFDPGFWGVAMPEVLADCS